MGIRGVVSIIILEMVLSIPLYFLGKKYEWIRKNRKSEDRVLDDGTVEITKCVKYFSEDVIKESTELIIPNEIEGKSVTKIGKSAFATEGGRLTSITIPESVTSIDEFAFSGCKSLASIEIPKGVTSISGFTFYWCESLTSITIPESVTSIGEFAFCGCESLKSITIPAGVTSIETCTFEWCKNLTKIEIPKGVTNIGHMAFYECESLTELTIPESVTSIGFYPVSKCSSLKKLEVNSKNAIYDSRDNCNAIINTKKNELIVACVNTSIPKSVTNIGLCAFYQCKGLKELTIPENVKEIGDWAFSGCENLTKVTIPASVASIGKEAFEECNNVKIYGYDGSNAQKYAKKNNISFVSLEKLSNSLTVSKTTYTKTASGSTQYISLRAKAKGGTITYTSSDKKIAVSKVGRVTIPKNYAGKVTITITAKSIVYKTVTKKVVITVKPKKEKIASITNKSKGQLIVKWTKYAYANGYELQYATNSKFKGAKKVVITSATTISKKLSGLKKGTTYYVRVRAYKKVGSSKLYGAMSDMKKIKITR